MKNVTRGFLCSFTYSSTFGGAVNKYQLIKPNNSNYKKQNTNYEQS